MRILMIDDDDQILFCEAIKQISSNLICELAKVIQVISKALKGTVGFAPSNMEATKLQTQYI